MAVDARIDWRLAATTPAGDDEDEITYPESDGKPVADNTKQFGYIMTVQGGMAALFADDPNVFVAGDLLWYPVRGDNSLRTAPDVMLAFGRPKGDRGAYLQWREEGVPPQVVFEIVSPGNRAAEMRRKLSFYDRYGVEEYYVYDPDRGVLSGWVRSAQGLTPIVEIAGWVSPRTGVRFALEAGELVLTRPDGRRFETFVELAQRADGEYQRAETERQRAEAERQRAEAERQRAERLAARLAALGIDPADI